MTEQYIVELHSQEEIDVLRHVPWRVNEWVDFFKRHGSVAIRISKYRIEGWNHMISDYKGSHTEIGFTDACAFLGIDHHDTILNNIDILSMI